ncbi:MAG: FtsQ-type POTRA domain-containing protein [Myxococcota bacterium]
MILRTRRNRRRLDVAKKTGEFTAAARSHGPVVFKVLLTTLATVAVAWGGYEGWRWANTSPRFALSEVIYRGAERASGPELSRLAGLTPGLNLFALDVEAVERALATHPWVKSVRVHRRLPSRLEIVVEEHAPIAVLALGELYLVDEDGVPFKRLTPQDGLDLPLVTGIDRERFVGDRQAALFELSQAIDAAVAYSRSSAAKGHPLSEVHVEAGEVTVVTEAGEEIRFGDGALGDKLARLERVRAALEDKRLTAAVIRLDDRVRPSRVTVQLSAPRPERGTVAAH